MVKRTAAWSPVEPYSLRTRGGRRKLQEPRRKETADGRSGQVTSAPRLCVEEGREGNGECSGTYKICGSKVRKPSIVTGGGS